jgi:hypothetical protein
MSQEMPRGLKRWEVVRKRGKGKFILQNGLLMFALPAFIISIFILTPGYYAITPAVILRQACSWALVGLLFGWALLDGDGEMVSEVHREERWSTRDLTKRWSEPPPGACLHFT